MPRGSLPVKKRQSTEEGSPLLISKKPRLSDAADSYTHSPIQQAPLMQGHGVLKPQSMSYKTPRKSNTTRPQTQEPQPEPEEQLPIDPSLFSMYPESQDGNSYGDGHYPYSTNGQPQNYNLSSQSYNMPSLEQIANEVLVDMNGNEYHGHGTNAPQVNSSSASIPNGPSRPGESVDSAVSLPSTEVSEQKKAATAHMRAEGPFNAADDIETRLVNAMANHNTPAAHPSIETNGAQSSNIPASPDRPKSGASNLPLYQPPAPLSQSPDTTRRQPFLPNGISQGRSPSPVEATPSKRKRDSNSTTPGTKSAKRAQVDGLERQSSREASVHMTAEEKQSMELAKMLQQEELGLRRRSK